MPGSRQLRPVIHSLGHIPTLRESEAWGGASHHNNINIDVQPLRRPRPHRVGATAATSDSRPNLININDVAVPDCHELSLKSNLML